MSIFVNGTLALKKKSTPGNVVAGTTPMVIGPNLTGAGQLPPGQAFVLLDEVSVSSIIRSASDIGRSAFIRAPIAPISAVPGGLTLPLGLNIADLGPQPDEPMTSAQVALGKAIFNDPAFSSNGKVSCATCHVSRLGFTDGLPLAVGLSTGVRNTPSIFNRAFGSLQFLDGRASSVENQASFPFVNPVEMGLSSMSEAVQKVSPTRMSPGATLDYQQLYKNAGYSMQSQNAILKSLGAFVRTTFGGNSRVDQYQAGNLSALNSQEISGLNLFMGKARCVACHSNSNFSDEAFHRTGVAADSGSAKPDLGRYAITGNYDDYGAFKTPSLRNVSKTSPYMHDGSINNLGAVIAKYNSGSVGIPRVDAQIFPLGLTSEEQDDL